MQQRPPLLTPDGGIRADLTIQRLAGDRFRIVTGAFHGARDEVWFRRHLPADRSLQFENLSSARRCCAALAESEIRLWWWPRYVSSMKYPKRCQYKHAKQKKYHVRNWAEYNEGLRRRGDFDSLV